MAICPNDGATLTELTTGVGSASNYVCTTCGKHFMGTGGILLPMPYTAGGHAVMTSSLINVSHGQSVCNSGNIQITPTNSQTASGLRLYVSGYSSSTFTVQYNGLISTSGVSFAWTYNSV